MGYRIGELPLFFNLKRKNENYMAPLYRPDHLGRADLKECAPSSFLGLPLPAPATPSALLLTPGLMLASHQNKCFLGPALRQPLSIF